MTIEDVWSDDAMERKQCSDFLTSYLLANSDIKVLNVNSPWGSGKSFFLERWSKELSSDHVCICFNAWDTDYTDEPLVALITAIEEQTADRREIIEAGKATVKTGTALVKKATPLIIKGLVKKYVGVEIDEILADSAGDAAEGIVEQLINEQSKTPQHVEDFKEAVAKRIAEVARRESKKSPAFVFIDELDRCRPTYAIELLERIKHFFELDDCKFIIASDTSQLAHSIRAVYGDRFHSERYLGRFFDAEFRLDNRDIFSIVHRNMFQGNFTHLGVKLAESNIYTSSNLSYPTDSIVTCKSNEYSEETLIIVALTRYFKLELREVLRAIKQLKSMHDSTRKQPFCFFWAAFLVFSKMADETLYALLTSPTDTIEKTKQHLATYSKIRLIFTEGFIGIDQIAVSFLQNLSKRHDTLYDIDDEALSHWEKRILRMLLSNHSCIVNYQKLVELAHRLS